MLRVCPGILVILSVLISYAQQTTDFLIVDAPIGVRSADSLLWVKWTGSSRLGYISPDSGVIYFSKSPGGGNVANYKDSISVFESDSFNNIFIPPSVSSPVPKRGIAFRAKNQPKMGSGVYYSIVAYKGQNDTFVSNEFQLIIESPEAPKVISPSGTIKSLTPTFQWQVVTGVPYYHIILSDDNIGVNSDDDGKIDIKGLSIVWQAITPNNQIVYGAPDPSGTITADPPPLSPGKQYSWLVLNNYGNHPAFSSQKYDLPGTFTVEGVALKKPVAVYPRGVSLTSTRDSVVTFRWTNLDSNANTYKIYAYITQEYESIEGQIVVWQTEVMAVNNAETMSVDINAKDVFTTNSYSWRVIATDEKGAGTAGDTVKFNYEVPTGTIVIRTMEQITNDDGTGPQTVSSNVGLVKIQIDVLDGSMEAPLFFYTDLDGYVSRERPTGTYRITAVKNEFETQTQTVVLSKNATANVTFYLKRPESTIYGKITDQTGKGINLVTVKGVSDDGDTISTQTDALGNFIFNCYSSDWFLSAQRNGYQSVLPQKVTVGYGENKKINNIVMIKNPITLSGVVMNSSGNPLLGVKVAILRDGALIEQLPATSQDGSFSFSVQAGKYTITASKTGFTTYQNTLDIINSKSVTIAMQPGASLISGNVYGKKWIDDREVIAPITNATIKFINISTSDTFTSVSGATYGDYKISLAGGQTFIVKSYAQGYASNVKPCTLTTLIKTTQILNDTIISYGMFSGTVYCSSPDNVIVNLLNTSTAKIAASGKSLVNGKFEIRNIPDGRYAINVGKDGYVLDSIAGPDTINVIDGRTVPPVSAIYLKPGTKTVKWNISPDNFNGSIKVLSPIKKTIAIADSLKNSGSGLYLVHIDAGIDSFLDLSNHQFFVPENVSTFTDSIIMDVKHIKADTLFPVNRKIILSLKASTILDSATLFYKDIIGSTFFKEVKRNSDSVYQFSIDPPKDGSTILYYFKASRGQDVFGNEKELYSAFVSPDRSQLTRIEIAPAIDDTLFVPSNFEVQFSLRAYYSSSFLTYNDLYDQSITWKLSDPQGCKIDRTSGVSVKLTTANSRVVAIPVILTATIDTSKIKVKGISNSVSIALKVSGSRLQNIRIKRIDAGNPNPLTTSGLDKAQFRAIGLDNTATQLDITAKWTVFPKDAGEISADGMFIPSPKFCGTARIFAEAANIQNEYYVDGYDKPGIQVRYLINKKDSADTVSNANGCNIVFPSGIVTDEEIGLLSIETQTLQNRIRQSTGLMKTVDSTAFSITEIEGISFNTSTDSIMLLLDVPYQLQKDIASGARDVAVAMWNSDSLKWQPLANSKVINDGKLISAALTHFSMYSIVVGPSRGGYLDVAPNPFSPYVWPKSISPEQKRFGTCISFKLETDKPPLKDVKIRIYTITGEPIWSMHIQNANQLPYQIWWDGKTSLKELIWTQPGNIICEKGSKMCRNGRYFVVLSAKDVKNKEQRYMKQIVLMR